MKFQLLLAPALLSFALTAASAPGLANTAPRTSPAVPHAALFGEVQQPATGVVTTSSYPMQSATWPATTPSVVGTYISTVLAISGTPCFNCVNGKTAGTFGSATLSAT